MGLHRILTQHDRDAALRLSPNDGQRIVRALEVLEASGRSILSWQADNSAPLIDRSTARLFQIEIDRPILVSRIERRLDQMIDDGATNEVRALLGLGLDPQLPAMRAIGVAELSAFLSGLCSEAEAIEKAKASTRQYAKRQSTWFRHQLGPEWRKLPFRQAVSEIAL